MLKLKNMKNSLVCNENSEKKFSSPSTSLCLFGQLYGMAPNQLRQRGINFIILFKEIIPF